MLTSNHATEHLVVVKKENREKSPVFPFHLKQKLAIPLQDGIRIIDKNDVVYAEAEGVYTRLTLANNKTIYSSKTLKHYSERLVSGFLRVHRSFLINGRYLTHINGKRDQLMLEGDINIPIARSKRKALKAFVNQYYD